MLYLWLSSVCTRLARRELHQAAFWRERKPHTLPLQADQIHLDPLRYGIIRRVMGESVQIEIRAQFAIGAGQQIFVEGGGHAGRIVISGMQQGRVLHQVNADQEAAAAQHLAHPAEQSHRRVGTEIADGAAGEKSGAPRRSRSGKAGTAAAAG